PSVPSLPRAAHFCRLIVLAGRVCSLRVVRLLSTELSRRCQFVAPLRRAMYEWQHGVLAMTLAAAADPGGIPSPRDRTRSDAVYHALRGWIIEGRIAFEGRLPTENELAL